MANVLGLLVGRKIQKAEKLHDYLQLWFDNGGLLNVFNVFVVIGGVAGDDVSQVIGCEVRSVNVSDVAVEIVFSGGKSLHVGMSDNDYRGPEAMEYIGVGGERIVW